MSGTRLIALALTLAFAGTGCGGYVASVAKMNREIARGDLPAAVEAVSDEMKAKGPRALPDKLSGDAPLLLLERGTLWYAMPEHRQSAHDWQVADQALEVLDLTDDTAGDIGRFLFSDDSKVYVAPAYEKMLLNTLNMANYLALGDLEGARVEARRLRIVQDLLESQSDDAQTALGSVLAGFTFEMSGRADEALRFYDEALASQPLELATEAVRRLAPRASYRSDRIEAALEGAPSETPASEETGDLLVVVALGRVPHKVAERIPIGLALTWAAAAAGSHAMTPAAREQAASLAVRGLLTWVMFPSLQPLPVRYDRVDVAVAGAALGLEMAIDVGRLATDAFDDLRGLLIGSAITRAITRALAGVAVEESTKAAGGEKGLGLLLGLALQGGLTAADTPDTRSWVTLPGTIWVGRSRVPAGVHTLTFRASGQGQPLVEERSVTVPPGGFAVETFTVLQ